MEMPASGTSPKAPTSLDWATLPTPSNSTQKRHSTRRFSEAEGNLTYESLSTWRGRTRAFTYVRSGRIVSQTACSSERLRQIRDQSCRRRLVSAGRRWADDVCRSDASEV